MRLYVWINHGPIPPPGGPYKGGMGMPHGGMGMGSRIFLGKNRWVCIRRSCIASSGAHAIGMNRDCLFLLLSLIIYLPIAYIPHLLAHHPAWHGYGAWVWAGVAYTIPSFLSYSCTSFPFLIIILIISFLFPLQVLILSLASISFLLLLFMYIIPSSLLLLLFSFLFPLCFLVLLSLSFFLLNPPSL